MLELAPVGTMEQLLSGISWFSWNSKRWLINYHNRRPPPLETQLLPVFNGRSISDNGMMNLLVRNAPAKIVENRTKSLFIHPLLAAYFIRFRCFKVTVWITKWTIMFSLPQVMIQSAFISRTGNIWVCTWTTTHLHLNPQNWVTNKDNLNISPQLLLSVCSVHQHQHAANRSPTSRVCFLWLWCNQSTWSLFRCFRINRKFTASLRNVVFWRICLCFWATGFTEHFNSLSVTVIWGFLQGWWRRFTRISSEISAPQTRLQSHHQEDI